MDQFTSFHVKTLAQFEQKREEVNGWRAKEMLTIR